MITDNKELTLKKLILAAKEVTSFDSAERVSRLPNLFGKAIRALKEAAKEMEEMG